MPNKPRNVSQRIEIVDGFEKGYKPRYKSDYFSQDGTDSKTAVCERIKRAITMRDNQSNNHLYTTFYLCIIYHFNLIGTHQIFKVQLEIDWVTIPTETNIRYSMPYKFQISNEFT